MSGRNPVAAYSFSARCLMMGPDHGAVYHLKGVWHGPALVQGVQDILPEPRQRPAPELAVDARPLAKLFRQIAPWRTGSGNPENPIKNTAVVGGFASVRGADGENEPLVERPLLVRHQVSCQADLYRRYQLESRSTPNRNLFCQHGLAQVIVGQGIDHADLCD